MGDNNNKGFDENSDDDRIQCSKKFMKKNRRLCGSFDGNCSQRMDGLEKKMNDNDENQSKQPGKYD